jgi:hypothetical protein
MLKNLNVVEMTTKTMRRDKTGRQIGRGPCNALTGPDNQTHLGQLESKMVKNKGNEGSRAEDVNVIC